MTGYNYIVEQGVILPDTADLRADVVSEYQIALGTDILTDPETPEGLLIEAETSARDSVVRNNAKLANQINPNYAEGVFLDAIWALTGGQRDKTTASTVSCTVAGVAGTIVTTSVRFRDVNGYVWAVEGAVTIGSSGAATVTASCLTLGEVGAATGTITEILVTVLGLETVTNPVPATLGTLTQSDLSARIKRRRTLGAQGATLAASVMAALYDVPNVRSLTFRENYTGDPITIEGITLVRNSMYACVDGGADADIAFALLGKKSIGSNWNGAVLVNVVDPASGQTYPVKFDRPTLINILVRVTTAGAPPLIDPQTAIRQAVLAYQAGEIEGEEGFVVGGDVSPFELAGAINRMYPLIYVKKVEIAVASGSPVFSTNTLEILINQRAFVTESAIQVLVT